MSKCPVLLPATGTFYMLLTAFVFILPLDSLALGKLQL